MSYWSCPTPRFCRAPCDTSLRTRDWAGDQSWVERVDTRGDPAENPFGEVPTLRQVDGSESKAPERCAGPSVLHSNVQGSGALPGQSRAIRTPARPRRTTTITPTRAILGLTLAAASAVGIAACSGGATNPNDAVAQTYNTDNSTFSGSIIAFSDGLSKIAPYSVPSVVAPLVTVCDTFARQLDGMAAKAKGALRSQLLAEAPDVQKTARDLQALAVATSTAGWDDPSASVELAPFEADLTALTADTKAVTAALPTGS